VLILIPTAQKMYVCGEQSEKIYQYSLSSPFDLNTTPTLDGSFFVADTAPKPRGITFSPDGALMMVSGAGPGNGAINQFSLKEPFNILTAPKYDGRFFLPNPAANNTTGLAFNTDNGLKVYITVESQGGMLLQYSLTSPFNLVPVMVEEFGSVKNEETELTGVTFSSTGSSLFICGSTSDSVHEYALDKPFDLSPPKHKIDLIGAPAITTYRFSVIDNTVTLRLNGTESTIKSYNGALDDDPMAFILGANIGLSDFLNMDLGEVLIYGRALNALEIDLVEQSLSDKWTVDLGFPLAFSEDFSSNFA